MLQPRYGQQVSTEDLYKNNKEIQKQDQEYNIDPKIDYAKSIESSVRYGVSQGDPVGDVFAPYGGVKGVDEDLDIQDLYDIPEARAQEQSGWDRFGNFTANMAIEAGLGSVEALGYMADMVNYEGLAKEAEDGFDSEFGKYFREIKEQAQENFPIYMTAKAQQGTLIEKMSEPSYWASQGKTVGTTLSLMLPGLGIAKGVGTGAKMLGAGLRASQAIGSAAAGLSSRLAESAMEANQQFQQNYAKYLAEEQAKGTGDTQAEVIARQRAGNIAANTFKGNMYLAPLDMLQYGLALNPSLLKTFNNLKKGIPGVVNTGIQMGSEAAEEGFQYVAGQEAISAEEKGTDFLGGEGFGNRLSEYIKEPEFQESALLGGLMGGLFEGIGKLSKAQNFVTDKIEAVKTKNEIRSGELNRDKLISDIGAGIDGDILDKQRSRYNSIIETKLGQENIDVDLKSSIENNSKTINDAFEYAQTESDNLESDDRFKNNPELRKELLKAKVASKVNQDYLKKLTNDVSELKSTLTEDIGEDGVKYLENEAGIATAKELIQETKKDKKLTPEKKKEQIAVLEVKKDRLEAANKELKKENPELTTTSSYSDQYKKYQKSFNKTKYNEDIKIKPAIAVIEALGAIKAAEAEESLKKESSTNRNKKATSRIKSNEDPDIIKADFIKEGGTEQEFNKLVDDVASKEIVPELIEEDFSEYTPYEQEQLTSFKLNLEKQSLDKLFEHYKKQEKVNEKLKFNSRYYSQVNDGKLSLDEKESLGSIMKYNDTKLKLIENAILNHKDLYTSPEVEQVVQQNIPKDNTEYQELLNDLSTQRFGTKEEQLNIAINKVKDKYNKIKNDLSSEEDKLLFLEGLLQEIIPTLGNKADDITENVSRLNSLIDSNSKKLTKKGVATQNLIQEFKDKLNSEGLVYNDISNRIKEVKEGIDLLTSMRNDLQSQEDYYNNLKANPNVSRLTKISVNNEINRINKKKGILEKVLDKLNKVLKNGIEALKSYVNSTANLINFLTGIKTVSTVEGKVTISNMSTINKNVDNVEKEIQSSLDNIESLEDKNNKTQEEINTLTGKVIKYQNNIRYLNDLLEGDLIELAETEVNNIPEPIQEKITNITTKSKKPLGKKIKEVIPSEPSTFAKKRYEKAPQTFKQDKERLANILDKSPDGKIVAENIRQARTPEEFDAIIDTINNEGSKEFKKLFKTIIRNFYNNKQKSKQTPNPIKPENIGNKGATDSEQNIEEKIHNTQKVPLREQETLEVRALQYVPKDGSIELDEGKPKLDTWFERTFGESINYDVQDKLKVGDELSLEVPFDNLTRGYTSENNIPILIKKDGEIVGYLPASGSKNVQPNMQPVIDKIRKKVYSGVDLANATQKSFKTVVTHKTGGVYLPYKTSRFTPVKHDGQYALGIVGYTKNYFTDAASKIIEKAGINLNAIPVGKVFQIIQDLSGKYVVHSLYTESLEKNLVAYNRYVNFLSKLPKETNPTVIKVTKNAMLGIAATPDVPRLSEKKDHIVLTVNSLSAKMQDKLSAEGINFRIVSKQLAKNKSIEVYEVSIPLDKLDSYLKDENFNAVTDLIKSLERQVDVKQFNSPRYVDSILKGDPDSATDRPTLVSRNNPEKIFGNSTFFIDDVVEDTPIDPEKVTKSENSDKKKVSDEPLTTDNQKPVEVSVKSKRIVSAKFTGQGTNFEIEIRGENKDFLLSWNRNSAYPNLWGEKQSDGTYKTAEGFPTKEDVQKLVDKYIPKKLIDLISRWTEASKLPAREVLNMQEIAEKAIIKELAALEESTPQASILNTETVDKVIPEEKSVEKPSIDEPADELNIDNFSIDDLNLEDLPDVESKILPSIPDDLEATGEGIDFKLNYTEGYKQWDKAKEIQWLKNKLSKVEFESITEENNVRNDIKNLAPKGANVWGYVKEAVIYLSEAAGVGTTYHEAFHIVSKYMLSDRQRIALYNEAKKEFGNLSDKLLEERLADKFMEYVESEGTDTSVKGRIKSFFKRLYTWIKYKLGGNLSIDEVFYAINTGTFNSVEPDPRNVSKFKEPIFKRIANFSPDKQEKASEMLSTMWSRTIDDVLNENPKFKNSKRIDVVNSLGVDYLAKKVMAKLINHRKELLKIGNSNADDLKVIFAKWYNHETKLFGDMGELAFRKIKEREGYKINVKSKFKLANTEGNPEQKQTEDETQLEGWQIDVQSTPGESGLSHEIRSLLYNIPMTINGTKYGDKYWGYQTNINGKQAYDLLSRNLADIFNIDVMMEKLNELSLHPDKEFTKQVIQRLEADSTLKTQFYTNMAMTHAEMGVIQNFYGEWKYYAGNRNSVDKMIVSEWETSANNTWMKTGKPELKQLDTVSTIGEAVKVFNSIGLTLKESDFAGKIGKKERFTLAKDDINYIIKGLNAGNNIFEDNISNLNNLGYIIKDNRLGLVESSYVGADGKKKYSINIPSFFAKQLYKIKQGDLEMYKSDPFYSESPMYKDLLDNTGNILDTLDYSLMDGLKYNQKKDGIPYAKMTKKDFEVYKINAYHNNGKKVGLFSMPILSDSPSSIYIKLPKLNTNLVFDKLTEVAFQEYYRIQQLEQDIKDKKIKNYDKNYSKFHFFPFLTMADFAGDLAEDNIKMKLINELTKKYDTYKEFITAENVLNKEDNYGVSKDALEKQSEDSFLRDYYFNDFYYRTQLITMTTGDPSFYKNATDFFKRAKEILSPGLVLDTSATFDNGKGTIIQTGKTFNSVYLTDVEEFMDELGGQVFDILSNKAETPDQQIRAAKIAAAYGYSNRIENKGTKDEQRFVDIEVELNGEGKKVSFLSKKVNVADAQAFISPSRYRKVQIGLGRWTNNLNSVLDKLIAEEKLSFEDTASVMQPLKPFYFGHIKSGNKVIPVQNKNSEYMLLPELVNKSPRLKALYEKMTTNNIDSFQFESAVKAGLYNAISIDNLNELTVDNIHVLNNADYSLQQETPEHYLDADNLYGTQYRKLLLADIDPNASFDIDGKSYTRDELVNEYQELIIANLAESYDKAHKELGFDLTDRKERNKMLSAMLVKEVQAKEYGNDIEEAVSLDKNDEFNLPLFDTLHSDRIEKMLTSIYRNNVTKQKIKGGSFVQTSNVGFMDDLELKISDGRLEYAEVYLPEWTREYFADRDITNIPEELREMIGYRIPTEDKYSMLPLRVKGFLPSNAGGAIMLPSAITTMAGSDFDVDKLYVLMPEFKIHRTMDYKKVVRELAEYGVNTTFNEVKDIYNKLKDENTKFTERELDLYEEIESIPKTKKDELTFTKYLVKVKGDTDNLYKKELLKQEPSLADFLGEVEEESVITYTKEQKQAIDKAINFIKNGNPNEFFTLEGKAGTGKTTIAKEIAKAFPNKTIKVAALSHKAKNVIKESFGNTIYEDNFHSIAGLLGYKLNLETGKFETDKESLFNVPIKEANIIIVDEASMINEEMLELIMEDKPSRAKVLFLGDIGQLPPIRTSENPYYKGKESLFTKKSPTFNTKNKASLTERIRQGEESPILPFADYYWNNSQSSNPVLNPVKERKNIVTDKGALLFNDSFANIKEDVVELFRHAVKDKNPNLAKVVVYKNSTRNNINNQIHKAVFGNNAPEFMSGGLVMFNSDFEDIENATEAVISDVGDIKTTKGLKWVVIKLMVGDKIKEVPVILSESKEKHKQLVQQAFNYAFSLPKRTAPYREALTKAWGLKNMYADLDYSYAITSHKSQGSTYDVVVVHEQDIMGVKPISNKNKSESVYTGITRAKNVSYIISQTKVGDNPINVSNLNNTINSNKSQAMQEIPARQEITPVGDVEDGEYTTVLNKEVLASWSSAQRNNRLLDISKAILTHPDTFSKTMKPGGFEDYQRYANIVSILRDSNKGYTFNQLNAMSDENLSDLAQEILDKKDDITVADPLSQIKMFNRNMSGAALIGIFANHNVNHAVLQFTDAEFDTPFLFDNKPYAKLNQAYIDGNRVMESLSQLLAASVDNAKDPNAFKANISTITADIAATMLRLGIPMETMIGFMGQPVIAHYLKLVDKYGGNFAAQDKAKQEILKVLGRQKQSNISTNDLYNSLKDKWNSGIQKDVFNNFLLYQELSTDLATVVRATRADATGAGPKLANNEKYINDMDKARSVESIKGLEDLWNGGVYPMVKSFYDLGIAKPNEDMNKLFWYDHPVIKGIKDEVRSKTGANLSPEDLDKLNSHIYTYFMSNCDILPFNDRDMAKKIIYDTPALLEKLKAKYANKYKVLKYLKVKNDRKSPFARIEFNALTSVTPTLIDELKASFMDMFYEKEIDVKDGKSDVRKLAENLLLYTYFRMGSVYGGNSFANVVPTEFYLKDTVGRLIREYKMQLDPETSGNFIKSEDYANFADQFIRNNWMNGKYVPKISTDLNEIQQRELSASKVPYWVKVNSKKGNFTGGEVNGVPQFKSYLSYPVVTVKGKKTNVEWVLMKMVKSQGGVAVYSPYNGLGYPATLVEYNMSGINESMVASNNVNKEIINKGFSLAKSLNLSTKLDNINTQEDIDNLKCVTGK